MVELSGTTAKCYPLNLKQNLWALLFGFCELPFGLILKKLPLGWFQCIKLDESPATDDKKSIKDILKGGSSFSKRVKENATGSEAAKEMQVKIARGLGKKLLEQLDKQDQERKSTGDTGIN